MISDSAIEVFKSACIQPVFLTLSSNDEAKLESLAKEVQEILGRAVANEDTPEWLKPHANRNGLAN
jgi:hypothetical protein